MIPGVFRDGHPRTAITVYGDDAPQEVDFIVDTGFEGDLALPSHVADTAGRATRYSRDAAATLGLLFCLEASVTKHARKAGVRQRVEFPRLEGSFSPGTPVFVPVGLPIR